MSCKELESDLALYAGGELDPTSALEGHLAGCPECRALVEDLRGLRGELAELRDVALPALGLVRPRPARVWPWVAAAIAAGAMLLLIPRPADVAPPPRVAWVAPAPALAKKSETAPLRSRLGKAFCCNAGSSVPQPDTEFVKLMTDDENVVILWAMNTKGDLR